MKMYIKSNKWPDFDKIKEAQRFLSTIDHDKYDLVSSCLREVNKEYGKFDYHGESPVGGRVSSVIRDYKCQAAEDWDDLSVEEADKLFDDIMNALEIVHADDAAAWT
jgi:hypothetical protein